ncbi:MAG: endonuclease III domain-containing protein [Planctomycetota bacterium]|jgi:endonuclease-3 related protein
MSYDKLIQIHDLLFDRYGPQHWWPGETAFEVIVGAILTQNTNWTNVEKAIANIKAVDALTPQKLYNMSADELAELIRPAGYFNIKAARLKNFLNWLFENYDGDLDGLENLSADLLRHELLGVKGIGPETADSIVLYAFGKPVFVIDTYTCRALGRHGLIEAGADYEQVREFFESNLPTDVKLFNEYHALFVCVGKEYCRPKPKCRDCPLVTLPHEVLPMS